MGKSERGRSKPQAAAVDSLLSLDSRKRNGAKGPKGKETGASTSQQSTAVDDLKHPQASDDAAAAPRTTRTSSKAAAATTANDKGPATVINTSQDADKGDGKVASISSSSSSVPTVTTAPLPELKGFSNLAQEIENDMLAEIESLMSRKRAIVQPSLVGESQPVPMSQGEGEGSSDRTEALYWKHMYEKLRDLRETEAERLLKDFTKHADEREKALQDLVNHLQDQVSSQQQKATIDHGHPKPQQPLSKPEASSSSVSSAAATTHETHPAQRGADNTAAELEAKIVRLKRLVLGYQQLTSFVLSLDGADFFPPDGTAQLTRFNCTAINHLHRRAVKFQLDLPYNQDNRTEMDFDACFRPQANLQFLPDELQQEVTFETKQCPMLALEVLRTLFENPE